MHKNLKALSLIELLVGTLITAILLTAMIFTPSSTQQTSKREAEKIYAKIKSLMQQADRRHMGFTLEFYESVNEVWVRWSDDHHQVLPVNEGFKISSNRNNENLVYSIKSNKFTTNRTLTVKRDDGKEHYIIIYALGGRVRTSDTRPKDENYSE